MNKPLAVLISDVHYSIKTLDRADKSMRLAIQKANELFVPLVVLGDLHDTKAHLRGECVNAIIATLQTCTVPPIILVGNHDRINERAPAHSLNFLAPYAMIIDEPKYVHPIGYFIPYQHDPSAFLSTVGMVSPSTTILCHQGVSGSLSGEYIQDRSAIDNDSVMGRRIVSGHYHTRQTVKLPFDGTWDYLGNPYTLNYGEAKDPEKGFQILHQDGSLEFVPTNLGSHRVMELTYVDELRSYYGERPELKDNDILKVKIKGPSDKLSVLTKDEVRAIVKFDDIVVDFEPYDIEANIQEESLPQPEIFDSVIDGVQNIDVERKERLKKLWRTFA